MGNIISPFFCVFYLFIINVDLIFIMIDFEQMFSLLERIDPQYRQTKQILNEGVETKNMSAAKHYLYDKMGYDEQTAMKVIGSIKHDIPNSRLGKCKFMLGVVRMYCNGEINNGDIISKLNQTLEYAASEKYIDTFNQDLNGLTCSKLIGQFEDIISQDIASRKDKMSQEQYMANNLYNIVKIDSFEEANKYSGYCDWCITKGAEAFENYGGDAINQFYFCLRNGFENEKTIVGDGCPLDSYGLSMISVSIRPDGSINTCTCRWNHDNGGNDHIMNDEQLSRLLGVNIYNTLKPRKVDIIHLIEDGGDDDYGSRLVSIAVGDFVIPDGVKYIGYFAFMWCEGLTSVTIPNSVIEINAGAFEGCGNLTSINIPNSVTEIGEGVFDSCESLTSITIPNSVTSIGYDAFYNCDNLTVYVESKETGDLVRESGFDGIIHYVNVTNQGMNESDIREAIEEGDYDTMQYIAVGDFVIPDGVRVIGEDAFYRCKSLTSITIPSSVTTIGKSVFYDCRNLTSVTIPNSVTSIGRGAFSYCFSLTSITIPNSVTNIGDYAFSECSNLTSITIPSSVTTIGKSAFYGCYKLTVYLQSEQTANLVRQSEFRGNIQYISNQGMNESMRQMFSLMERIDPQYRQYKQLINEADSRLKAVDRIIDQVFSNYFNPDDTVSSSEYYVNDNPNTTWRQYLLFNLRHTFGLMQNSDVKYLPLVARLAYSNEVRFDLTNDNGEQINTLRRIVNLLKKDDNLFNEVKNNPNITFGQLAERFKETFAQEDAADAEAANSVQNNGSEYTVKEVPDFKTAKYYGDRSCSKSKLCYTQSRSTWNSYTKNGMNRVYVCLRNGWKNIPEEATEGNPYDLYGTSMIFVFVNPMGNLVTSNCRWNHANVDEYDGDVDHAFTKATLSQTIGMPFDSVFKAKVVDKESYIRRAIEDGDYKLLQDIAVGDFVIPDGVRVIGEYAFEWCRNLTSIKILSSVTSIGSFAFSHCSGLTSITIPNGVTSIGDGAFSRCSGLTSVTIGNSVTTIGNNAFRDCSGLTSINIPNSVTSIGGYAFCGCSSLTSVTIPNSVTYIDKDAFVCCYKLTVYVQSEQTANLVKESGFGGNIQYVR